MHQSVVTTASHTHTYGDGRRGIEGLMCGVVTFQVPPHPPAVPGKYRDCDISQIYHIGITIIKTKATTLIRFPQCRAFQKGCYGWKVLVPAIPRMWWWGQWLQMTGALPDYRLTSRDRARSIYVEGWPTNLKNRFSRLSIIYRMTHVVMQCPVYKQWLPRAVFITYTSISFFKKLAVV